MGSNTPLPPNQPFPSSTVAGSMPVTGGSSNWSNAVPPGGLQTPGGLVLNFFGSNFTGQNSASPTSPPPPPKDNNPPPSAQPVVPFWQPAPQSIYPTSPVANPQPINAAAGLGMAGANGNSPLGLPQANPAEPPVDPSKLSSSEQLNALYKKYNQAQQQQDTARKAVEDAEKSRNDYLTLGNAVRNAQQATQPPALPPAAQSTPPALPPATSPQPPGNTATITPAAAFGNPAGNPAIGAGPEPTPSTLPADASFPSTANLSPEQQALAAQALQQSGLPGQQNQQPQQAPTLAATNPQTVTATNPQTTSPPPPGVSPAQSPQAMAVAEPGNTPSAPAMPPPISGAKAETLNNLIFTPEELVQFKKLNSKEQIDWITQRNLQTKADAIGEIAIQSGLPTGNKFPPDTYERLDSIAKLDTKDIKGPAGDDLRYFRKTALWTLGLLNGSQNATTPVKDLPGLKSIESIARDPKETKDIRIAAAQALQAINRGNTKEMQDILKRINSNDIGLLKPWSWLRARTPQDVRAIVEAARKGIPIQANQQAASGASPTGGPSMSPATDMNPGNAAPPDQQNQSQPAGTMMPAMA